MPLDKHFRGTESVMRFMTRRDFLRTGLAAGAAVAVPAASGRAAGANEAIRLGLIGCGARGNVLLSHFARIEGVRIGGLCDPDRQTRRAAEHSQPYRLQPVARARQAVTSLIAKGADWKR